MVSEFAVKGLYDEDAIGEKGESEPGEADVFPCMAL